MSEHNHNPLIYGFLLSFVMVGIGMALGFVGASGSDFQSVITIYVFGGLSISAGAVMLRNTFKTRDECLICKDRYRYGKKN